ncbi:hypothetical protein DSM112329_05310 [Paraconexibacter sp. AEG42_29]|uniref:CAAX prenyl protease 2/Lysostaphin resistance protein A-like domain-containing protein n=1 Tax=Paraconexibacter sp. AEG42_29 TaxID=2997339 RepID=A0AAU7B3A9_9ACTN
MSTPPPPAEAPTNWLPPDPNDRPAPVAPASGRPLWSPITAIAIIPAALLGSLAAGLVIGIIAAIFGADLDDVPPSVSITATYAQDIVFVVAVVLFASLRKPVFAWQFGLRSTRLKPAIGWTALAFLAIFVFSLAWGVITGNTKAEKLPESLGVEESTAALVATAVLVTIFAPIAEEILFRGYVFPALRNWKGTWPAVALTGLLFGLLHVASSPLYALAPLSVFGALLCLLYLRTRSLYPCIALHALNNCVAFGSAPDVGWDWQILPFAVAVMAVLTSLAWLVRQRFGPAPPELSPV